MKRNLTFTALLLALALAGLLLVAGCTGTGDQAQTPAATPVPTVAETAQATATPTPADIAPSTTYVGTGNGSVATEIPAGIYTVTVTQANAEETELRVESKDYFIGVPGRYSDAVAASAKTANGWVWSYALQTDDNPTLTINATGEWEASFAFPQQINGIPPQTFHGIGNAATPFFMINEGNVSFAIDATNTTEIEVHLMDFAGNPVMDKTNTYEQPLASHRGDYHDTVVVPIAVSDNYLMNIICDGDWSVTVTDDRV